MGLMEDPNAPAPVTLPAPVAAETPQEEVSNNTNEEDDYLDLVTCGSGEVGVLTSSDRQGHHRHEMGDCEAVLDVQESFVSCVEGVSMQQDHENTSTKPVSLVDRVLPDGGPHLSMKEATMFRQRLQQQLLRSAENSGGNNATMAVDGMPEIDLMNLNLCGTDSEDIDEQRARVKRAMALNNSNNGEAKQQQNEKGEFGVRPSLVATVPEDTEQETEECNNNADHGQCAICSDQSSPNSSDAVSFARLPCCGNVPQQVFSAEHTTPSKVQICSPCIFLLTHPTLDGSCRVGHCPRCREWISVKASNEENSLKHVHVSKIFQSGFCKICKQSKNYIVDTSASTCDACFLGRRNPLLYECEQCHGTQRIPHPMYRYQSSPGDFGSKTWSCEGPCQFLTHWRIRHDQLLLVPVGDAPWPDTDWTIHARQHIQQARKELQIDDPADPNCVIL